MSTYQVISDPSIDGVAVNDVLQGENGMPYNDLNSPGVWIAVNVVEQNPSLFQQLS